MFKKTQQIVTSTKDAGTVIGNGIILENITLKGIGVVRVDGVITGEIQLEGHLVLGETGKIIGTVHAGSAMFFGSYEGNLHIEDTLHVASTGRVDGNVMTSKLIIDEGAEFHGTCNMDESKADKSFSVLSFAKKEKELLPSADVAAEQA